MSDTYTDRQRTGRFRPSFCRGRELPAGPTGHRRAGTDQVRSESSLRPAISATLDSIGAERAGNRRSGEGTPSSMPPESATRPSWSNRQRFFYPAVPRLAPRAGRSCSAHHHRDRRHRAHTAQRYAEGFVRSLGKEISGRGSTTAQLVQVEPGAGDEIRSTCASCFPPFGFRFGQVIRVGKPVAPEAGTRLGTAPGRKDCAGHRGFTGNRRAIATVLARDRATVIGLDIPPAAAELDQVTSRLGGRSPTPDITTPMRLTRSPANSAKEST